MKKDKEWLKEKAMDLYPSYSEMYEHPDDLTVEKVNLINKFIEIIDQLDEPEQTDTNVGLSKPVIPQFVAEQLEYWKRNKMNILWQFFLREIPSSILSWLEGDEGNYDKLLDAEKNGYEVENEKLYKVVLPTGLLSSTLVAHSDGTGHFFSGEHRNDSWYKSHLTEAEIKAIDERYWAFAEEVTE